MKKSVAKCLTSVCSGLIYLLHNRQTFSFNRLELQSVQFSFSQFGEDLAICRIVEQLGLNGGVYVDAGAYHPIFGSNTLLLHKRGWRGINIDLDASRIATFGTVRQRDHNVVACLSDTVRSVEVAHYEIPSTDRIVDTGDTERLSTCGSKPIRYSRATTATLTEIIQKSPFRFEDVQYLNVDCEYHDLPVLRGLDFKRCRPMIVSIEAFTAAEREAILQFLSPYGYRLEAMIPPTCVLVRRD